MQVFDELYQVYKRDVYSLLLRLTGDPHQAEELTQEVFIRVFKYMAGFRGDSTVKTWLIRITYNVYNTWRKNHQHTLPLNSDVLGNDVIGSASRRIILDDILTQLTESEKLLITLRDINDLPYQDIAEILNINIGQVRVGLHRARKKFRKLYEEGSK